jgi:hypothetical protein
MAMHRQIKLGMDRRSPPSFRLRWLRLAMLLSTAWIAPRLPLAATASDLEAAKPADDSCAAEYPGYGLRASDELWLINTRNLPRPSCAADFTPSFFRYDRDAGWQASDQNELANAPPMHTVVYVHGNRISYSESVRRGWDMYQALVRAGASEPLRLVIWSWPSDQIRGQIRDVRYKAELADEEGFYLGAWLVQWPAPEPAALIGYSYGSRVIGSCLHLLGGGALPFVPRLPADEIAVAPPTRTVLIAAAMDCDCFSSGQMFGGAMGKVERALVLYNPCDPILRFYPHLDRCRKADAMGVTGAVIYGGPTELVQINVGDAIGRSHDLNDYLHHRWLMSEIHKALFRP